MVRVSPDGRRLAVTVQTLSDSGVWVYDLVRGTLTCEPGAGRRTPPSGHPNGRRLVFDWLTGGRFSLAVQPADSTVPPQLLMTGTSPPRRSHPTGGRWPWYEGGGPTATSRV